MRYHPRHALARAVRALSPKARAAVAVGAALAAAAGALAATGTSGAATTAYTLGAHNISMGGHFAGLCLDDYKQSTAANAPVVIWTCSSSDPGQQWYWASDGTLHLGSASGPALGVYYDNSSGGYSKVVLNSSAAQPEELWQALGDWGVVNIYASRAHLGDAGPTLMTLNDPGYSSTPGTQLIIWQRDPGTPTGNAQFNMPSTTYARTASTNRPDSGAGGDTWALGNVTRFAAVSSLGGDTYQGSFADDYGTFVTVPGNTAPNGSGTIANVVQGSFNGTGGYSFTADGGSPSASNVPAYAVGGPSPAGDPRDATSTGNWYQLFFPQGTTFGGTGLDNNRIAAMGWEWTYGACAGTQTWADTAANGSGSGSSDGNITGGC